MTIQYRSEGAEVQPCTLSAADLCNVGRIIRAYAAIEALVDAYLCEVGALQQGHLVVLLGVTAASKRLEYARTFAELDGADALARHVRLFEGDDFKLVTRARNVLAHGTMLGKLDSGEIAFETQISAGNDNGEVLTAVVAMSQATIQTAAAKAEKLVTTLEAELQLASLLETRRRQPLRGHPKA